MILLPFFKRLAGIAQCAKQRFVEAFASRFAVEAFNGAILLGLSGRDVMPIDTGFLNAFEDRHAGELGADVRHDCLWHAAFGDHAVQLSGNPLPRQRCICDQHQILATEVINDCQDAKTATIRQGVRHEIQ